MALTRSLRSEARKKALAHLKKVGYGGAYVPVDANHRPADIEVISTGSLVLNKLLGCGGLPRGRIIEVFGPEAVGKCLPADTYIYTPQGVLTVGEIFESQGLAVCTEQGNHKVEIPLFNRDLEPENTTHFTYNHKRITYTVTTLTGVDIRSTARHPHLVMNTRGNWVWKCTDKLEPGDYLVCVREVPFGDQAWDEEEAYMLGLLLADGCLEQNRIAITNDDPCIKKFVETRIPDLLGIAYKKYPNGDSEGSFNYHFNSKEMCGSFYDRFVLQPAKSPKKEYGKVARKFSEVPLKALLQGYFDCEMWVSDKAYMIEVASTSKRLARETKLLLRRFGIMCQLTEKEDTYKGEPYIYWRLVLTGQDARNYVRKVGTKSIKRLAEFEKMMCLSGDGSPNIDSIPNCGMLLRDLYDTVETGRVENSLMYDYMGDTPNARLTYDRLSKILATIEDGGLIRARLEEIQQADYFYDPVKAVTRGDEPEPTFDFAMSRTHSFLAEGVVTHNTTLALSCCIEAQREGGFATYIDFEQAVHLGYAQAMGLDLSEESFAFFQPDYFEMGAQVVYDYTKLVESDIIVVDSVSAMIPKKEFEKGPDETPALGALARLMSVFLNQISKEISKTNTILLFVNQMRANIKTSKYDAGPDWTTSGGKSLPYYSSVRLRLKPGKTEYANVMNDLTGDKEKIPIANFVRAEGHKNKVGFPKRKGEFVIRYGEGIDNIRSIIEVAERHKIVKKAGSWYEFGVKDEPGYFRRQGVEQFRRYLVEHMDVFEMLMDLVSEKLASYEVTKITQNISDEDLYVEEHVDTEIDRSEPLSTLDDSDEDIEALLSGAEEVPPPKNTKKAMDEGSMLSFDSIDETLNS